MSPDPISIAQHAVLVIIIISACCAYALFWRLLAWAAVMHFCVGAYGWALLAFFFWFAARNQHRRFMAEARGAGFYNGRWVH